MNIESSASTMISEKTELLVQYLVFPIGGAVCMQCVESQSCFDSAFVLIFLY